MTQICHPERNVSDAGRHLSTGDSIGHALLELRRHLSERSRSVAIWAAELATLELVALQQPR
jgi:hypothetical protein